MIIDRRALARAITIVESDNPAHHDEAQRLLSVKHTHARRIGISGAPGVGKSTLIESLGLFLLNQGKHVAVLAIDPSSPITGGSILGDKTRMPKLSNDPRAFVRPSPSRGVLGGVSYKTPETITLCEIAGFDIVIVETVGVGQSETAVNSMVDVFVLLIQPGSGDELQGVKRGIVELADVVVVTKFDLEDGRLADETKRQYTRAVRKKTPVLKVSALTGEGIEALYQQICI